MSFEIKFIGKSTDEGELGEIEVDDLDEQFVVPITYWDKQKYESQWQEAIERIVNSRSDANSMLVVSIHDPKEANFIVVWPLYKINNKVYVQNSLIFMDNLKQPFNEQMIYSFVPERGTISEDTGEPISEWQISLDDLATWLSRK